MRFGIFYEHQIPRPWHEDSEYELLQQSLDQIELADRLGYDYAWEVEHHFLEEYSHSSAPEVFLGAASQRTSRIRLGHGIIQLTTNHPARVAERVATLDLVSHGRVEFGMGESATTTELHPFDVRFRNKRDVWEDAVRACLPDVLERRVGVPRRALRLPVAQRHPQAAAEAAPAPVGRLLAARDDPHGGMRGMGALGFQFVSAEAAQAWVHAYYNAYTKHLEKLCEYQTNPNIAVVSQFMCAPTDEEARARAEGSSFFQFALGYYATHPPGVPGEIRLWEEYLAFRDTPAGQKQRVGGLIGSPETIRDRLRRFEESQVDQVILLNQAGKNTHEDICSSLELFASEVMPEFHERHGEHEAWKASVLAGDIELEEIDTTPFDFRRHQAKT